MLRCMFSFIMEDEKEKGLESSISQLSLLCEGFPCGSASKESACNVGDLGLIPGLERSPGGGSRYHKTGWIWNVDIQSRIERAMLEGEGSMFFLRLSKKGLMIFHCFDKSQPMIKHQQH